VLLSQVADTCVTLAADPARRQVAIRALARTAITDAHIDQLRDLVGTDVDLRWRTLIRLAELGSVDQAEVDRLASEDPDPDAWVRALAVDSARPDAKLKDETWKAIFEEHRVPMGSLGEVRRAFWRRSQGELLASYADRYLEELPSLHKAGMIPALAVSGAMFPRAGVGTAFADRAVEAAEADGVAPVVRSRVIENVDKLRRMVKARAI
jgi:aminopeptidase N